MQTPIPLNPSNDLPASLNQASPADRSTHTSDTRYVTSDIPGIGGAIKNRPEDFLVEELPQYDPCGEGEHIYLFVEKKLLSTFEMLEVIAAHFGVPRHALGYAGLKDKLAVTRQVVSVHVPGKKIENFPMLAHDRVGVLWADYHTNKLRPGHLRGNRFSIRVRDTSATNALPAHRTLRTLALKGAPNRFGEQRFGANGTNHLVGRALLRSQFDEAAALLLGPNLELPGSPPPARAAFAAGDLKEALLQTPRHAHAEQRALRQLLRGRSAREAMLAIDESARKFYLSAFQSAVFNSVLDERIAEGTLAALVLGDLAFKHDNRAVFAVDDAALADLSTRERLARIEISPSGPMWGASMMRAASNPDAAELRALASFGVSVADLELFAQRTRGIMEGARRPLRVPVIDPAVEGGGDEHGPYVRCAFELPRGAFATVVLREIMKPVDPRSLADDATDTGG